MQRTARERVLQALLFEAGGLLIAAPLYECAFGRSTTESFRLMAVLAIAVLIWTPLHNWLFDRVEHGLTGRSASARPHGVRLLHALSHDVTPIAATLPLIMVARRLTGGGPCESLTLPPLRGKLRATAIGGFCHGITGTGIRTRHRRGLGPLWPPVV